MRSVSRSVGIARSSLVGAGTVGLVIALAACGPLGTTNGVSKDKVAKAMTKEFDSDPDLKNALPKDKKGKYIDCVAGVFYDKANKDDLKAYVAGSIKSKDVRPFTGDQSKNPDLAKCDKFIK
jgi:hypothetical protein